MNDVSGLLGVFDRLPAYRALVADLKGGRRRVPPLGLLRAARPALLAALARDLDRPLLVVVAQVDQARAWVESLLSWCPAASGTARRIVRLPEPLPNFYERAPWGRDVVSGRLRVLSALDGGGTVDGPPVILASARALMQPTLPQRQFRRAHRTLERGQLLDMERTLSMWVGLGYAPAPVVEAPGQFSRRGGILDIFPPAAPAPVRIELFGDEIESLRDFDPATQRSQGRLEAAHVTPATEALPRFGPRVAEALDAWDLAALPEDDAALFRQDLQALADGTAFKGVEFYLPLLYSRPATLLDYFPEQGLVLVDDVEALSNIWAELERHALELRESVAQAGLLPPDYPRPFVSWSEWQAALAAREVLELAYDEARLEGGGSPLAQAFTPGPRFGGQLKPLVGHIRAALNSGEQVLVVSRQATRLAELWAQEESPIHPLSSLTDWPRGRLNFVQAALAEGWSVQGSSPLGRVEAASAEAASAEAANAEAANAEAADAIDVADAADAQATGVRAAMPTVWHLLTDAEIFGWARPQPRRRRPHKVAPETFFADMTPGDYVVHIEHGLGLFRGLTTIELERTEREYLLVQYRGGDKLYVPIHQADRLSRYIGGDERPPRLHRLGGVEWSRARQQAQEAAAEVAEELLELYATRAAVVGHAFSADTPWQAELEAAFPYLETEDQLRAIREVKADMERARPMDRLICGDVGYGKTEVALRAAFKAVMDNKQIAILVPTTVLAQQHYYTFRERLSSFPVEVEMLSRFRTRAEQQGVIERLAEGHVDIVIGTHRLLSQDVQFKDLGLLVVDEEQRFGVAHKERLKQMRTEVDVLTMTATPIPRTLYMSLTGVRDISTIDTPPEERLPVRTYAGQYDDNIVRHAILREVDRGGQVFFVHNRVMSIDQVRRRLEQVVPEVLVTVGHGQMREAALERVMLRFVSGEVDVLLSTNIIESGLDIPNANTIIVNQADRFGLAQLYQLRGRVGRGAQQAFAYFLYDYPRRLTEDARRRLDTIREASELGAGYTIAMRDLEIRGAGDILGARQHGHISAVGFDLYTRLLAQSVQELKAQETGKAVASALPAPLTIDLPLTAYIPSAYVHNSTLRLRLYRRMAQLVALEEVDEIAEEMADRFGPIPDEVDNLFYQLRLKVLAGRAGVEAITIDGGKLAVRCARLESVNRVGLQRHFGRGKIEWGGIRVSRRAVWVPFVGLPQQEWRVALVQVLEALAAL